MYCCCNVRPFSTDCNPVTPWLKHYSDHLISDWWFNLGSLTKYQDFDFVIRLTPLPKIKYHPKDHFCEYPKRIHYDDLTNLTKEEFQEKRERNKQSEIWPELHR